MEATIASPPPVSAPRPVSVMGAGEEITDIEELKQFHTPRPRDKGDHNYHEHNNLTDHYTFAKAVIDGCRVNSINIDAISFKVDKVQDVKLPLVVNGVRLMGHRITKVANRFFLIARINNPELQVADDVETFIVARNSHDKRVPMELAIGNRVIICSNLMFGGDIHVKSKNTRFGFTHFHTRMQELFTEYNESVGQVRADIEFFKGTNITEAIGHQFIGHNSGSGEYVQPGRTHRVHEMWMRPEHRHYYQTYPFNDFPEERLREFSKQENPPVSPEENWTLWRLLNAYTYVHRGDLAIDKETNEPYLEGHKQFETRTNQTALKLKKEYTSKLWGKLKSAKYYADWYFTSDPKDIKIAL